MTESFLELVRRRNSIRGYLADPVPDDLLRQVLEAGRLAPSACNLQPWRFVVVREESQRQRLCKGYDRSWMAQAPVVIVLCIEPAAAWVRQSDHKNHADVDGAIAVDHMTLCAAALGLGSCWVCAFDPAIVREVLNIPPRFVPLALIPLGYPAEAGRPKVRKPIDEIVFSERFEER